jgi:hypothetical protein
MLLGEDGAERLSAETAGAELLSSVLLVLETRRNLVRLAREGTLPASQYEACRDRADEDRQLFVLRDLTLDLCESQSPRRARSIWPICAPHCGSTPMSASPAS